jgi:O-antigen ligase
MKDKIVTVVNYINLISFFILACSILFFYNDVMRLSYYAFFASYVAEIFLEKKWKNFKKNKYRIFFILLLGFYLLGFLSYIFDSTPKYFEFIMIRRLPLLPFSIVGLFGMNKLFKIKHFFNALIITSVTTSLYLIIFKIGLLDFITRSDKTVLFWFSRVDNVNDHLMYNFYLNLALIGIWYLATSTWNVINWWKRILYILSGIFLAYIVLISEGRMGVTACLFILSAITLIETWERNKIVATVLFSLSIGLSYTVVSHHKRMSKDLVSNEPRIFLWQGAMDAIKEKPIFGYGLSNGQERFDIERAKIQPQWFKDWANSFYLLDCHNQYLQTTLEYGIFGLLIVLFFYLYPLFIVQKTLRILVLLITGLGMYQSIFDIYITGTKSILFCMITLILFTENERLLKVEPEKNTNNS